MPYNFTYDNKSYTLEGDKCSLFFNDEAQPLEGIDARTILAELERSDMVSFDREYYDQACEVCHKNRNEGAKYFSFLEFHFYLFSKGDKFVMSSLSPAYEYKTLPDLLEEGTVDGSYIVSINVCPMCGDFTIDLEYGLW